MSKAEILKGCEHDGSFIPVIEVKRLMQQYSDQENARLTAIVSKQDELIVILKALPVAVGKRSVELWEKFTELESELEKLKAE